MVGENCGAPTRDGQPCTATGLPQFDGRCVGHQERAADARAKGGRNSSLQIRGSKVRPFNQLRANDQALRYLVTKTLKRKTYEPDDERKARIIIAALRERRLGIETALKIQRAIRQDTEPPRSNGVHGNGNGRGPSREGDTPR